MPKKQYNFRVPEEIAVQVESYLSRTGISPTQFFTEATIEKLSAHSQEHLLEKVELLQQDVLTNREELARATKHIMILLGSGKKMSQEQVLKLVDETLNQGRQ